MYYGSTAINLKATMNTNQMNSHVTKNTKLTDLWDNHLFSIPNY